MRQRFSVPLLALALILTTGGVVLALNYSGEDVCQDAPAWPGGSYLGQMHPYHVGFYQAHAASIEREPCEMWALDQRYSAVRGMRELGYTVFGPGEFAWPEAPSPLPDVDATAITYQEIRGWGEATGTLTLLPGVHEMQFEIGGWHAGPTTVTMGSPDVPLAVVHDGLTHYAGTFTVRVPRAGVYQFNVHTTGAWNLWIGERPPPSPPPAEEKPAPEEPKLNVENCEILLFG